MSARELNKAKMIEAFRRQDWESFKLLSQEKEKLKKSEKRYCSVCGVILSKLSHSRNGGPNPRERCGMHQRNRLIMKPWLNAFGMVNP